jgi:23S rRNA pseudouridine1911/1915/1917 synthase
VSALPGDEVWQHRVTSEETGRRLDHLLVAHHPDRSRSQLQRLIREGLVLAAGARVKAGYAVEEGDLLEMRLPAPVPSRVEPEDLPLAVVLEKDGFLVVDKPAGMVVHPSAGHRRGTLVAALLHRYGRLSLGGGADRPGIVHRLDRNTSGLIVVARDERTHRALADQFRQRSVSKFYQALVWGRPREDSGTVERPVGRDPARRTRMAVGGLRARSARTNWRVRETMPGFAFLDVDLHTGRTHQIRVHLSSIGYPVVGDETYGGRRWRGVTDPLRRKALRSFDRLALHAARLEFEDPSTGDRLRVSASLPEDIRRLLVALRR